MSTGLAEDSRYTSHPPRSTPGGNRCPEHLHDGTEGLRDRPGHGETAQLLRHMEKPSTDPPVLVSDTHRVSVTDCHRPRYRWDRRGPGRHPTPSDRLSLGEDCGPGRDRTSGAGNGSPKRTSLGVPSRPTTPCLEGRTTPMSHSSRSVPPPPSPLPRHFRDRRALVQVPHPPPAPPP